jgi:hypothetical protein
VRKTRKSHSFPSIIKVRSITGPKDLVEWKVILLSSAASALVPKYTSAKFAPSAYIARCGRPGNKLRTDQSKITSPFGDLRLLLGIATVTALVGCSVGWF